MERADSIVVQYHTAVCTLQEAAEEVRAVSAHVETFLQGENVKSDLMQEMLLRFIEESRAQAKKNAVLWEALSKYLEASGFPLS